VTSWTTVDAYLHLKKKSVGPAVLSIGENLRRHTLEMTRIWTATATAQPWIYFCELPP
jgi:hypothetical protein